MIERFDIAGYARISVDEELDRDNVSIENQKSIIEDFVTTHFPHREKRFPVSFGKVKTAPSTCFWR